MIVSICLAIVASCAIAKTYLVHEASVFEIAERVVDGGIANRGQPFAGRLKNLAGSGMVFALKDNPEHCVPLGGQFMPARCVAILLCCLQYGFRLILNQGIVKRDHKGGGRGRTPEL